MLINPQLADQAPERALVFRLLTQCCRRLDRLRAQMMCGRDHKCANRTAKFCSTARLPDDARPQLFGLQRFSETKLHIASWNTALSRSSHNPRDAQPPLESRVVMNKFNSKRYASASCVYMQTCSCILPGVPPVTLLALRRSLRHVLELARLESIQNTAAGATSRRSAEPRARRQRRSWG